MNALLNIGLNRAHFCGTVSVKEIHAALDEFGVTELKSRLSHATSLEDEQTYIAHVQGWTKDKAYAIAKQLDQDCIAHYDLDECEGALVGPDAAKWGAFDARHFKLL